jgi:hypothetical protein
MSGHCIIALPCQEGGRQGPKRSKAWYFSARRFPYFGSLGYFVSFMYLSWLGVRYPLNYNMQILKSGLISLSIMV